MRTMFLALVVLVLAAADASACDRPVRRLLAAEARVAAAPVRAAARVAVVPLRLAAVPVRVTAGLVARPVAFVRSRR